jgi:hypothetical protein
MNGEIITEETCTQGLQTFHHSKPYKGSPIKANSLPLTVKKGSDVQFDPVEDSIYFISSSDMCEMLASFNHLSAGCPWG